MAIQFEEADLIDFTARSTSDIAAGPDDRAVARRERDARTGRGGRKTRGGELTAQNAHNGMKGQL